MRTAHTSRRHAGFTLVELMVVVSLVGILAALAVVAFNRNQTQNDVDNWSGANRDAVRIASRRAVATGAPYMVEFTPSTVQWCAVKTLGAAPTYLGTQVGCAGLPTSVEQGSLVDYGNKDARSSFWVGSSDIVLSDGVTYNAPAKTTLSTRATLYFGRGGASSTNMANVMTGGLPDPTNLGFTLYIRRKISDPTEYHRRLVVFGIASKTRVVDNY